MLPENANSQAISLHQMPNIVEIQVISILLNLHYPLTSYFEIQIQVDHATYL